jgi:hypothetical protein
MHRAGFALEDVQAAHKRLTECPAVAEIFSESPSLSLRASKLAIPAATING